MKIDKYKKASKGKYKVLLSNNTELLLFEEVILKYNLLLKKEIDEKELISIDKDNQEWDVYYVALNNIKARAKSVFEIKEFLLKKEYPENLVEKAINKLIEQGYLNDRLFAKSYINSQLLMSNKGPLVIQNELLKKKIDSQIILEEIEVFTPTIQQEKIRKIVQKMLKANHTRGGVVLKQKIFNDIKKLGYDTDIISNILNETNFSNNEEIAKKEYEKLYRKLSKKYSGKELEYKIKEKLFQKGLIYED